MLERWLRLELYEQVQNGELEPKEAEAELKKVGLPAFQCCPDPARFNPISLSTWTLVMGLGWIMYRSLDAARELWDPYRAKFQWWSGKEDRLGGQRILLRKQEAGLAHLTLLSADRPDIVARVRNQQEAFRLLCEEAQGGRWKASGLPTDGGPRREITSPEWADFHLGEAGSLPLGVHCSATPYGTEAPRDLEHLAVLRDRVRGTEFGYDHVRLPAAELRAAFPIGAPATKRRLRGDFSKVEAAHRHLYGATVPDHLDDADVVRGVAKYLADGGGRVPHPKTILKHVRAIRER